MPIGLRGADLTGSGPLPGQHPLDNNGQMHLGKQDRCPVCGMQVIKYPKFACAIQLKNKSTFYFCGTGCLLKTWLHPEAFLGKPSGDVFKIIVQEYFSGQQIDAREVVWVSGSDVIGPMGPAMVPLKNETYLKVFKKRHGGKDVFYLKDLNEITWQSMTGRNAFK
jgi:nitrous oxide reductase accessory protein NosL